MADSTPFDGLAEHALPFVTVDDDDHFHVNPEAVAYLRSLTGRVAVVSIAGLYRTGKSYLLNALSGNTATFGVGPTVKPCTKGIWLWGKALPAADGSGEGTSVIFLDTEGLGSTVRSETYDCRIFALALLLSSVFIYNSVGVIDGNAVSKLSLVVQLTRHIHVKSQPAGREDSGTDFASFFPSFMWVVRDFGVRLEKDGRRITAREYLEDALKPEDGLSDAAESKNAVRQMIRNFFPERDCTTLVRPVTDEKALAALSSTPLDSPSIRPEFRAQLDALRRKLVGSPRPKTLYGRPLTGAMLAALAGAYVQALNTTGTPTIATAWDRVVDGQCAEAVEAASGVYTARMRELMAKASRESGARQAATAAKTRLGGGAGGSASGSRAAGRSGASGASADSDDEDGGAGGAGRGSSSGRGGSSSSSSSDVLVEAEDMLSCHSQASADALKRFAAAAVQDADKTPPYEAKLRDTIDQAFAAFRRANDAASSAACKEVLEQLYEEAARQLVAAVATAQGGAKGGTVTSGKPRGGRFNPEDSDDAYSVASGAGGGVGAGAGTGDAQDAALQAKVTETAAAVVSSTALAKAYRAACSSLQESYAALARGPARDRVLSEFCCTRLPGLLLDAAGRADDTVAAHTGALVARQHGLSASLASSRGREKAAAELAAQERRSAESALAEQARQAGETAEKLRATIAARDAELQRAADKFERLVASFEGASIRSDEEKSRLMDELSQARARLDAVQSERLALALDAATAAARLAEAREAQLKAEKDAGTAAAALAGAESRAAVLVERVRGAENETVRLREETELLYESNKVTKDLLQAKVSEGEELEFQWGQAKAKLAQADAEKSELQAEVTVLETLLAKAKAGVVKGKVAGKMPALDKLEQRRWDALPQVA